MHQPITPLYLTQSNPATQRTMQSNLRTHLGGLFSPNKQTPTANPSRTCPLNNEDGLVALLHHTGVFNALGMDVRELKDVETTDAPVEPTQ